MERIVSIFRNGRSQAVRIPREFELPGKRAILRREGGRLFIEPVDDASLASVLSGLEPLGPGDRLDVVEDLPADRIDL
ncbi:MAG: AbrB/MazE/SpoVT family DNA-binding domain-containing protein [Methylobacterium sp.]|uniref:antitoxin n=1 Tax=Methylobacterium sp. TaxID=409 RepID=UPI0025CBBBBC|nr:AbrB/MazE/SpoVT family DNA-binding domain-containing protein [Methylobacterium sp.]MBX9932566.1 AbrB/MazE/SpoVT family DNA-binding domain-containing protein [Methylobacterium sp.]